MNSRNDGSVNNERARWLTSTDVNNCTLQSRGHLKANGIDSIETITAVETLKFFLTISEIDSVWTETAINHSCKLYANEPMNIACQL